MALFDIKETKSIYTELGNKQDICYYCVKALKQKYSEKLISYDEMMKTTKELRGHLTSKRIAKIDIAGNGISICEDCLSAINNELGNSIANIFESVIKESNVEDTFETPSAETVTLENKTTITKKKAKK